TSRSARHTQRRTANRMRSEPFGNRQWGISHARSLLTLVSLLAAGRAAVVEAASGQIKGSAGKGLNLVIDTQWVEGTGYRPVWIDVVPITPTTADRTLHVELKFTSQWPQREMTFAQDIDIPAATATTFTTQLSVPQEFSWQMYELNVWEDGRFQKSLYQRIPFNNWNQGNDEGLPTVLVVTDKPIAATIPGGAAPVTGAPVGGAPTPAGAPTAPAGPNTDVLALVLPVENVQMQAYGAVAATQAAGYPANLLATVAIDRLPQRWIDYTSVDLVCVPLDLLERLAVEYPERWTAIRRWTSAGGNLLVSGIGTNFEQLAELERLLDVAPTADPAATEPAGAPRAGWTLPNKKDYNRELERPFGKTANPTVTVPGPNGPPAPLNAMISATGPEGPPAPPVEARARSAFVTRPIGMGLVVAIAAADPFAEPAEVWGWILRTLTPERWASYRRLGVSQERENTDFWNWLIPGVGLAPVNAFMVLITAFVIAIGPVNYFWLKRNGRLHLLLLIVPLCAFSVTGGLFGYAVLADGLGVRVRARSFTAIDQRRGEAVCWSRISYHAGMAPSGGLNFPADVAVTPYYPDANDYDAKRPRLGLIWSEEQQNLASGWLLSRTPAQLLTVRSRASAAGVRWIAPAKAGDPPRIENRLETPIERLLLADEEGNHYRALDVPPGAIVELETADVEAEQTALQKIVRAAAPAVPDGFDQPAYATFGRRGYNPFRRGNTSLPAASLGTSRLEHMLRVTCGMSGTQPQPLAPGSYLAVVGCSPEVVWGVPAPKSDAGLHVVVGRW
ncbi:MAG TPA: hypothetical protein VGX78_16855, partial [Pirellulales bacterium]|nr:hypothetical protein [Pirellulales bacterium]